MSTQSNRNSKRFFLLFYQQKKPLALEKAVIPAGEPYYQSQLISP